MNTIAQIFPRTGRISGPEVADGAKPDVPTTDVENEKKQETLKGFTTGTLVTSQTRTSPRFSRLHFRLFQVHPKFLGYSTHVTRSVTMRRNILTSA